jgi:hypothetical protein
LPISALPGERLDALNRATLAAVKRKARKDTERTSRRRDERDSEKLAEARERLHGLEAGGSSRRPIDVVSSTLVETHALATPCPRCDGIHDVLEHAAVTIEGVRLREARLRCRQCGSRRSLWFRLVRETAN